MIFTIPPARRKSGYIEVNGSKVFYELVNGFGIKGGHYLIKNPNKGVFFPDMSACKKIQLNKSDIVLDFGAFCGTYAAMASLSGAKVIAYEASPRQFEILKMNSRIFGFEIKLAAVVGDNIEFIEFYPGNTGTSDSIFPSRLRANPISVRAVNFYDAAKNATVFKMDIEGGEYLIDGLHTPPNLRAVVIEFHHKLKDWKDRAKKIIFGFESSGFKCIKEPNFNSGFSSIGTWER